MFYSFLQRLHLYFQYICNVHKTLKNLLKHSVTTSPLTHCFVLCASKALSKSLTLKMVTARFVECWQTLNMQHGLVLKAKTPQTFYNLSYWLNAPSCLTLWCQYDYFNLDITLDAKCFSIFLFRGSGVCLTLKLKHS